MADRTSERNLPISRGGGRQLQTLQTGMNDLFRSFFGNALPRSWLWPDDIMGMDTGAMPATDVVETDKDYRITAELPGMETKDVSVTISEGNITIKGEKREERKEDKNGYFRQERSYGQFQRVVALPPNMADENRAEATMNKGVLTITVPKKAEAQARARKLDIRQSDMPQAQGGRQGEMRQGEMPKGDVPRGEMRGGEPRQGEGGRSEYGRGEYGRGESGRGDYEKEARDRERGERPEPSRGDYRRGM